jgi:hypothetical protein
MTLVKNNFLKQERGTHTCVLICRFEVNNMCTLMRRFVGCDVAGECKITGLNLHDRNFLEKLLVAQRNEISCVFYRNKRFISQHKASGL